MVSSSFWGKVGFHGNFFSIFCWKKIVKILRFWFVLLITTLISFQFFTWTKKSAIFHVNLKLSAKKLWFREFKLFTVKTLISRVSRIFWIRNPDELLTFIWISFFFRRLKIHPDKTEVISWEKTMVEVEISCSNGWTAVPYCDNRLILQKSLLQKRN